MVFHSLLSDLFHCIEFDKVWWQVHLCEIPHEIHRTLASFRVHHWEPRKTVGTLRYEDGKARTGTTVDAWNFRGSCCVVKNKMLKMRIFSKDSDVNNSNFVKAIPFIEMVTSFRL